MVIFHLMDNKTVCDHHADYRNIVCKVGKFNSFCVQMNTLHHCTCQNRFDTDINIDTGGVFYTTEIDNSQRGECTAGEIQEAQTVHAAGPSHVLAVLLCAVVVRQNIGNLGLNLALSNYNRFFAFLSRQYPSV